ncbi:hypothetical protein DPMN_126133 [Dreissena polymorpha]|uniref:PLEKHM2 PH domain-containing protein n=1 Tax=Dreissena polymorpha TaxID=45954 RepID=A0A9D4JVB8_DREPO|nr:hypothetical protein DPMN_126133 [Dreissena polymorpha]
MFTCCQGHTEGKVRPVYALVTSRSLYLLERQQGKKKFSKTAAITFSDIDFVSVSEHAMYCKILYLLNICI